MITKLFVTLGVIVICLWVLSSRKLSQPKLNTIINPASLKRNKHLRIAAFIFMITMTVLAVVTVYMQINSAAVLVTLHVTNTQSGKVTTYRVIKDQIGNNHFTTENGRQIYLAGVERMEVEKASQ